jgi:hypothetical protein
MLYGNKGGIRLSDVFRAMNLKARILGDAYRGQTIWGINDYQKVIEKTFEILHSKIPERYMDELIHTLVLEGLVSPSPEDFERRADSNNFPELKNC